MIGPLAGEHNAFWVQIDISSQIGRQKIIREIVDTLIRRFEVGSLSRNIASQLVLQIARYVFPFVTIPYLARVLGPESYSVRVYLLSFMGFIQILIEYGFNSFGTKVVSENRTDTRVVSETAGAIALSRAAMTIVGLGVILISLQFIGILRDYPAYTFVAFLGTISKSMLPDFVFQGIEDMRILTTRFVVSQSVAVALIFSVIKGPSDLLWVAVIEAVTALVALTWSWSDVVLARGIRLAFPSLRQVCKTFAASTTYFISSASTFLFSSLTTILIGIEIDDRAAISYWSLATTIITAVQSLYIPLSNSLFPRVCRTHEYSVVTRITKIGIPLVVALTIVVFLYADFAFSVLGGNDYLPGYHVLQMLSPLVLISFPSIMIGFPILAASGNVRLLTISSISAGTLNILLLMFLSAVGNFSMASAIFVRVLTELVLLILRGAFAFRVVRQ